MRVLKFVIKLWVIVSVSLTANLVAEEQPADNLVENNVSDIATIQEKIEKNIPSIKIEAVNKSDMPGVYEILSSGQLLYVSEDGKYLISGKLFSIENGIKDLTAASMERIDMLKAPKRRDKIKAVSDKDMIIFKAPDEKYKVTVFTDVDCSFCRKLHKEMDNYNKLGITIQYMGFPRAGIGSPSHKKLQSVWCADDPLEAMNKAKNDRVFGSDSCDDPLTEQYKLVREFGLNGTPALILKSGKLLPGFVTPNQLLAIIKEDELSSSSTVSGKAE